MLLNMHSLSKIWYHHPYVLIHLIHFLMFFLSEILDPTSSIFLQEWFSGLVPIHSLWIIANILVRLLRNVLKDLCKFISKKMYIWGNFSSKKWQYWSKLKIFFSILSQSLNFTFGFIFSSSDWMNNQKLKSLGHFSWRVCNIQPFYVVHDINK